MQGFLTIQTIKSNESFVFMGNRNKVPVKGIGTYRLVLDTEHYLDLFQTLYVPTFSRNLVSLPKLDVAGFVFKFGSGSFSLFKNSKLIGSGILCDGLYKFKLDNVFTETLMTLHHNGGIKCSLVDENSAYLWHKRLGHISKERMQRLIKMKFFQTWILLTLKYALIVLKENKQSILRNEPQEEHSFLKLYTLTYVDLLMLHLLVERNILLPLLMIFHVMVTSIYCMTNLNLLMHLKYILKRLRGN